jgi:hypothetical protein
MTLLITNGYFIPGNDFLDIAGTLTNGMVQPTWRIPTEMEFIR